MYLKHLKIKIIFKNLIYDLIGRTVNFSIEKKEAAFDGRCLWAIKRKGQ